MTTAAAEPSPLRAAGGCTRPVLLRGRIDHVNPATGELLRRYVTSREPGGVLPVACKTRRASRCLPCAETYRADTYQLVRAGLAGGKGVPAAVADHPAVFVTLTAPSFGPVHTRRETSGRVRRCRPRRDNPLCPHGIPASCTQRHGSDDPRLGEPLCPDCYDYTGSVLFNALAPELWRRFTITLRRALARQAGITATTLGRHVRVSYAKVAEYQRRGVVHFHAIIRLDGPAGPGTPPPSWATAAILTAAIKRAVRAVQVRTPAAPGLPPRTLAWGGEHDIRLITTTGELTDSKVAGYVAKYATKAAECTGTLDRRITPADQLAALDIRNHPRRLIATCLRLGQLPDLEPLRLAQWAHMLGFRGHFSTKAAATPPPSPPCVLPARPTSSRPIPACFPNPTTPPSSSRIGTTPDAAIRTPRSTGGRHDGPQCWHLNGPAIRGTSRLGRPMTSQRDELLTVAQVLAALGGVSPRTFYRWREIGKAPPAVRLPNGELRIWRSELTAWLDRLREEPAA